MTPTIPPDPHLTALLAAAYRLGVAAGSRGGGAAMSGIGVPLPGGPAQVGGQFSVPATAAAAGAAGGGVGAPPTGGIPTPMDPDGGHRHHHYPQEGLTLAQLATQQNIAATLRDDAMRDALSRSEQRRQALEIARWAQLASMRGTPTRSWMADTGGLPFRI